jgi:hypothetical protein
MFALIQSLPSYPAVGAINTINTWAEPQDAQGLSGLSLSLTLAYTSAPCTHLRPYFPLQPILSFLLFDPVGASLIKKKRRREAQTGR